MENEIVGYMYQTDIYCPDDIEGIAKAASLELGDATISGVGVPICVAPFVTAICWTIEP